MCIPFSGLLISTTEVCGINQLRYLLHLQKSLALFCLDIKINYIIKRKKCVIVICM